MNAAIRSALVRVARDREVIYYSDLAPLVDLDMSRADDRNQMASLLDEISRHENEMGRGMLTVVVVRKEAGRPGHGFYELARELGLYHGRSDLEETTFFVEMLQRVHSVWRQPPNREKA